MHQDSWDPQDKRFPTGSSPDSSDDDSPAPSENARFAPPLLNWHVVEIDGEATLIEEREISDASGETAKSAPPVLAREVAPLREPRPVSALHDHVDDIVIGGMQTRRVTVMPGESAEFEVTVANHGRWSALFEISVEGWIDEAWTPDLPLRVQLEPYARQVVKVAINPPRQSQSHAGEHALVVVVRAARYPGHVTRLAATLVVERYAALTVGAPQPPVLDLSWSLPFATTRLPITNQSNYAATVHLQGMDRVRQCDFVFYTGGYPGADGDGRRGAAHLTLQPGQSVVVAVEIRTRQRPFFGIVPRMNKFRLVAHVETEPPLRRTVDGQLAIAALIGPWHMAIAAVLGVVALFGTGLAGLALLLALRTTTPSNVAPPAATPIPPAPVVAFVIQMDQAMPTRAPVQPNVAAPVQLGTQDGQAAPNVVGEQPSIPVVRADQVTAPGEPTPVGQQPLRPLVVTTPSVGGNDAQTPGSVPNRAAPQPSNSHLTYGEMFRQVASNFDLDWRVLAAQAYLESGFDSLALSGQGDMGLMQIRPGTWNEFAPTVDASDPFDSYSNVLVGAAYLNYLRDELSERGFPQQEWMLVAYNWGPDKVFSHIEAGGTWESLDPERRQYAEDILRIAATIPPS